jgi:CRP-like cAMP-binding protein
MEWPLLNALADEEREAVLGSSRRRKFARGEVVFHEGDPGDSLHLIESGRFAVRVSTPAGDTAILNVLRAGETFGELALLRRDPPLLRSATVTALEGATTLMLSRSAFQSVRRTHPEVEQMLSDVLAQRVDALSRRLIESLHMSVDRRVYLRLSELSEVYGNGVGPSVIPLSQDVIAEMAGATRPTVNQVLQKLASQRIIELGRGQITVLNRAELSSWVGPT